MHVQLWRNPVAQTIVVLLLGLTPCARPVAAQHPAPTATTKTEVQDTAKSASFWMEQKLRLSQEILKGLASGDFALIGKSAEIMQGLNKIEVFVRREPEGYRDSMRQFVLANDDLIRASAEENLEGATLAFNQLTVSCVNCHRHLRESGEK